MRRWLGLIDEKLRRPVSAYATAFFRMVLGASVWFEARENMHRLGQYTPGQLHLPYVGESTGYDAQTLAEICAWQVKFAALIVLGFATRIAALGALVCQGALFLVSQLNFRNHVYLMLLWLALLVLFGGDQRWSLQWAARKAWNKLRKRDTPIPATSAALGVRLIQAQVVFVYFYSGLHKLLLDFGSGFPLCRFLGREITRGRSGDFLNSASGEWLVSVRSWIDTELSRDACWDGAPKTMVALSVATIAAELLMAVGLCFRRTAWLACAVGFGLHASIFATMDVVTFGAMMVATYPLFLVDPPFGNRPGGGPADDATEEATRPGAEGPEAASA